MPSTVVEQGALAFVVSGFTPHISARRLLEACFEKRRRLAPHVAAHIIARASSALASLGVPHAALDLARIGIDPRGEVIVLGLGASHAQLDDRAMPDTRRIGYGAPEVVNPIDADERADVFSLGVVLWEMLTLRRLFPASSEADARARMQASAIPPPTTLAREVPEALEAVVMRALSVDKSARFESVAAFAKALDALGQPVQGPLLARLSRALVDPASLVPGVAEYAKAWRGIEADEGLLDMLTASLPTFFPKSFGDEPMRSKRVTNMPPRTQTLIGVTSPLGQQPARAAQSGAPQGNQMGRVPVYQPKATLVGMVAPRATYAEASVPTNASESSSPNRRAVPTQKPPGRRDEATQQTTGRRDGATKVNRPQTMPPPLPPEATRWPSSAPKPAPVPEVVAPPAPAPQKGAEGEWDDEDTTFYSRQEGWDEEPRTEVTELPPVDQLPTSTIPQRAMGAPAPSSAGQVAAPKVEAPKVEAPAPKSPAAVPKPAAQTSMRSLQAKLPEKSPQVASRSATILGISAPTSQSATTSGITTTKPKAPAESVKVPVPEAKAIRAPIGAAPAKRATPAAVPARVVRVGTPVAAPAATAPASVPPPEHAHKITSPGIAPVVSPSGAPPQDPSWSALLESNIAAPAGTPVAPASAAVVVPPPAQFVVPAAAGARVSPDTPTVSAPLEDAESEERGDSDAPPSLPPNRGMQLVVALLVLGAIAAVAFLVGRVTAPKVPHPHAAPVAVTPPAPPVTAHVPTPAPVPTPTVVAAPPPAELPDAAVAVAPPVIPPPPEPEPEPTPPPAPVATTTPRPTATMRPARMVTMAVAPAMTVTMRPVIRAPDF